MNLSTCADIRRLSLDAEVASDLMVPHVVSVQATATLQEAASLLTEKNVSAVPVLDGQGEPRGVLSRTDLVAYDSATYAYLWPGPGSKDLKPLRQELPDDISTEKLRIKRVRDIMTPVLFSVAPDTPASTVIDALLSLAVHRLFVTDPDGAIIGVISAIDILRKLRSSPS
jgi:CBS domain-containing protein